MRSVFVGGFVAGSSTLAMKILSFTVCLTISTGSETSHSMVVSFGGRYSDANIGWSATPNRWEEFGCSEVSDELDVSDEIGLGMSPRADVSSFPEIPSSTSAILGEVGLNGLGKGKADVCAGVNVNGP